nr:hypothetical protein [Planctomycetota bacterium]
MTSQALLVAGPLVLDDIGEDHALLGGGGGYAVIAASAFVKTQLWARGGKDISPQVRGILERRGIDMAGVSWDGATPRWTTSGFTAGGPLLSDVEPTSAENLGGVLLIDLPPAEGKRAIAAIAKLHGAATRPVVVAPRPADCQTDHYLEACAAAADVLILPGAAAAAAEGAGLA